jgi:hypothetical protein
MNPKLIVIDGKTYDNVDEMPADVRKQYEQAMKMLGDENKNLVPDVFENMKIFADKDQDGIPDALEGLASSSATVVSSAKIIADGKEYNSLDELPPEVRVKYEQAMGNLDANRNGIPDFLEGMLKPQSGASDIERRYTTAAPHASTASPSSSAIEPESTSGWVLGLLVLMLLGVCALGAIGVWYYFLR